MVRCARELFGERGYEATSMDEVAARAGVSKPMLYAYFGSKDGLLAACIQRAGVEFRERVRAAAGPVGSLPPDQRLWHGLVVAFKGIEENLEPWNLLYPLRGPAPRGPLAARAAHGVEAMAELTGQLLAEAAEASGHGPAAVEQTAPLAQALAGAAMATVDWWRRHPEETAELQALRVMNFAWRGFEQLLEGRLWLPPPGDELLQ
jgi:AcrR family transcriptional regulator